jgi:hypothetical protein
VEDPLLPEECEDPKNQKKNKDQKEKTLLFHLKRKRGQATSFAAKFRVENRKKLPVPFSTGQLDYCNLNLIGMVPHCST